MKKQQQQKQQASRNDNKTWDEEGKRKKIKLFGLT